MIRQLLKEYSKYAIVEQFLEQSMKEIDGKWFHCIGIPNYNARDGTLIDHIHNYLAHNVDSGICDSFDDSFMEELRIYNVYDLSSDCSCMIDARIYNLKVYAYGNPLVLFMINGKGDDKAVHILYPVNSCQVHFEEFLKTHHLDSQIMSTLSLDFYYNKQDLVRYGSSDRILLSRVDAH